VSRSAGWNWLLESARRITAPGAIQIAKRSVIRPPHSAEALALTISALGALNRHTGVHTINLNLDGKPHAVAVIEGATFEQREGGITALIQVESEKPS
jgi:hypothetical protein